MTADKFVAIDRFGLDCKDCNDTNFKKELKYEKKCFPLIQLLIKTCVFI